MSGRRLTPAGRRAQLVEIAAGMFADRPYDGVRMDEVAERAGISRALLYRHFAGKRDLFAAVYREAADRLLASTRLDPAVPLADQLRAVLDLHLDYFVANREAVLAGNRVLAGDPTIQAIISDELAGLRDRAVEATGLHGRPRAIASAVVMGWLAFVRVLVVEWLVDPGVDREHLREIALAALFAALDRAAPDTAPPDTAPPDTAPPDTAPPDTAALDRNAAPEPDRP